MGWKSVKDHYDIKHNVAIQDEWDDFQREPSGHKILVIGSSYVSNIISVNLTTLELKQSMSPPLRNADLQRYWDEMHADLGKLRELLDAEDQFERDLPVYTYEGGDIIELLCEAYDWPNVTHDGRMMYENSFFRTRAEAIEVAKRSAASGIRWGKERLAQLEEQLAKERQSVANYERDLAKLKQTE